MSNSNIIVVRGAGARGPQGIQGPAGSGSGGSGGSGSQGLQGVQGSIGSQGHTGSQGIQGLQGRGVQGIQGPSGTGIQGSVGQTGVQGIQGPSGSGSGSFNVSLVSFTYEQMITSNVWSIVHNLNFRPNVLVMDYGQNNIECDIAYVDANSLTLTFSAAVSGYAYLS